MLKDMVILMEEKRIEVNTFLILGLKYLNKGNFTYKDIANYLDIEESVLIRKIDEENDIEFFIIFYFATCLMYMEKYDKKEFLINYLRSNNIDVDLILYRLNIKEIKSREGLSLVCKYALNMKREQIRKLSK